MSGMGVARKTGGSETPPLQQNERGRRDGGGGGGRSLFRDEVGLGEGGHAAVEGEGFQACAGVVVGDEAVEEAGAGGGGEGVEDLLPIERGNEAAGEGVVETGAGDGAGEVVVVDECRVGFANGLIGRKQLASPFIHQSTQPAEAALEVRLRLPGNQSDEDRGVNSVATASAWPGAVPAVAGRGHLGGEGPRPCSRSSRNLRMSNGGVPGLILSPRVPSLE